MSKIVLLKTLQTLLTPLKRLIDRKAENVNWDENDPSASGYIANRPFYKGFKNVDLVPSMKVDFSECWNATNLPVFDLIKGETYTVIFDGVEYQCVAVDDGYGGEALGNFYLIGEGADTGEPFFIYEEEGGEWAGIAISIEEEVTCTVQISGKQAIIHKIDSEYLPDLGVGVKGTGDNAEVFNGGNPEQASGSFSHAEGADSSATNQCAHAEGLGTEASGMNSHSEGQDTLASGWNSHAEGQDTTASGEGSHAEGMHTITSSQAAHAEGFGTKASGASSHAEGSSTKAYGNRSHAEGEYTQAGAYENNGTEKGKGSHAEGYYTKAFSDYQHVQGKFNISDINGKYAHIVGNGESDSARSNAHTLDWNGVGWFAGGLKVGGTGQDDEAAVEVALKSDITNITPESIGAVGKNDVITIPQGGTGATTSEQARKNLGVPYYAKYDAGNLQTGAGDTSAWITYYGDNGTTYNQMDLGKDATSFSKPVNLTSGGTGASNQTGAWSNIVAPGGTMTGTITLHTTGLKTSHAAGYTTNQYGNFVHQSTTANDTWGICSNSGAANFKVAYETGNTTIAGTAYIKKTIVNDAYPSLLFATTSRTGMEHAFIQMNATNSQLGFYSYATDQDANSTKYYEGYYLPTPDSGRTAKKTYPILTGKSPVTIAQGGTGLTKASDVQSFFMNSYTATGDIDISTKDVFTLPPGIYHHESETSTANHYPIAATRALVEVKGQYRTGTASAADGYPNGYWSIRVYYPYTGEEYWNHRTWSSWQGWRRVYNSAGIGTPLKISGASTPGIDFYDSDTNVHTCSIYFDNSSNRRLTFKQLPADMDSASTRYGEYFRLPTPASGLTANKTYDILTTKQVVYSSSQPAYEAGKIWLKPV